jgi:hypothetical protein
LFDSNKSARASTYFTKDMVDAANSTITTITKVRDLSTFILDCIIDIEWGYWY